MRKLVGPVAGSPHCTHSTVEWGPWSDEMLSGSSHQYIDPEKASAVPAEVLFAGKANPYQERALIPGKENPFPKVGRSPVPSV